jgi:hypothetical protein
VSSERTTPGGVSARSSGYDGRVSGSAWGILWLAVALKVPILALLYLVWWAIKDPPVPAVDDDGGSPDRDPLHPRDRPPRPPRRGPHGPPEPASPARVRVAERRTPRRVLR